MLYSVVIMHATLEYLCSTRPSRRASRKRPSSDNSKMNHSSE